MEEDRIVYTLPDGRKKYIPQNLAAKFEQQNPMATQAYQDGTDIYDIPVRDRNDFLKEFPKATPYSDQQQTQEPADQQEPIQQPAEQTQMPDSINGHKIPQVHAPQIAARAEQQRQEDNKPEGWDQRTEDFDKDYQAAIGDINARLEAKRNEAVSRQQEREGKMGRFVSSIVNAGMNENGGAVTPEAREEIEAGGDDEARALRSAAQFYEEAKKTREAAVNGAGFGKGLADAFTIDNWDFGITDLVSNASLYNAAVKEEKGEKLTDAEQALLDAAAHRVASDMYYGNFLGRGYKAGLTTGQSLPFMAEFMMNPAAGGAKEGANVVTRALGRAISKKIGAKYGTKVARDIVAKPALKKALQAGGRVLGDVEASAIMSGTTGLGGTIADTYDRMTGDIKFKETEDGIKFDGIDGDMGQFWPSFGKAYGARTIENFSEMFGDYFLPIGKTVGGIVRGVNKSLHLNRVNDFINGIGTAEWMTAVNHFLSKTHWDGIFGETGEELVGGVLNALTVGDQTVGEVFDKDNLIDTFLGVSAFAGFVSAVKTVGYRTPRQQMQIARDKLAREAAPSFATEDDWNRIRQQIDNADEMQLRDILSVAFEEGSQYTPEQKTFIGQYARMREQQIGYDKGRARKEEEMPNFADIDAIYDAAVTTVDPEEKRAAKVEYDSALADLSSLPKEEIDALNQDPGYTVMLEADFPEMAPALERYVKARAALVGINDSINKAMEDDMQRAHDDIESKTAEDGNYYDITLRDGTKVGLKSGVLVRAQDGGVDKRQSGNLFVTMPDGKVKMVAPKDVESFKMAPAADLYEQAQQQIREAYQRQLADDINTPSKQEIADSLTGQPEAFNVGGATVMGTATQVTPDGNVVVQFDEPVQLGNAIGTVHAIPKDEFLKMRAGTVMPTQQVEEQPQEDAQESAEETEAPEQQEPQQGEETQQEEAQYAGERDFRGRPMPMKEDGRVDQAKLFESDPEAWAEWETKRRNDGGKSAQGYLKGEASRQTKQLNDLQKKFDAEADFDKRDELGEQIAAVQQRIDAITKAAESAEARQKVREARVAEPQTPDEVVAQYLSAYKGSLDKDDFLRETGYSDEDLKGFVGGFVKEGSIGVQRLAEIIKESDDTGLTSNLSDMDIRDSILNVLSQVRSWNDVKNFIKNNRAAMAEEQARKERETIEAAADEASYDYELSEENNEFGKPFVLSSDGTTIFGEIGEDSGLTPAPIKLNEGEDYVDEKGRHHGYGLIHIEEGHGDQIREAGFGSVREFVETVARNYNTIREGNKIADQQTYLLELTDEHNNTVFIELSRDGSYWNVNSAGIYRVTYSKNKKEVKSAPAIGTSTNADADEVNHGQIEGETVTSGDSSLTSSDNKDNEISETSAEISEKQQEIAEAEAEVDTEPTEAQKEAGNYKKGHIKLDGYDISIEQPKGSVRSGTDAQGREWSQVINNTYGYIRGTEGVDGDHIDVFLSDNPEEGNVYVVDQVNPDGTFDEHKVMYGFPDMEAARAAYLSNYKEGWTGLGAITGVSKEEFKKWIESSHRKTKPFSEYSSVKTEGDVQLGQPVEQESAEMAQEEAVSDQEIPGIAQNTEEAAQPVEEVQEQPQRYGQVHKKAEMMAAALNTPIVVHDDVSTVEDAAAASAINAGEIVKGWMQDDGTVHIYAPNADSLRDVEQTVFHEVVAHKGLREMLGEEGFNELCDRVWDAMDSNLHSIYHRQVLHLKKDKDESLDDFFKRQNRAAADEYMAEIAERMTTEDFEKTDSIWKKIVDFFRDIFHLRGADLEMTDKEISDLLSESYKRLRERKEAEWMQALGEDGRAVISKANEYKRMMLEWMQERDEDKSSDNVRQREEMRRDIRAQMRQLPDEDLAKIADRYNDFIGQEAREALNRRQILSKTTAVARAVASIQMLHNVKAKPVKKVNLYDYVGKDKQRPMLIGVKHEDGYAVATDATVLIADKASYQKEKDGKTIAKDGKEINGVYPDWKMLFAGLSEKIPVDIPAMRDFVASVREAAAKRWEDAKARGEKSIGTKKDALEKTQVFVKFGDNAYSFRLGRLSLFLDYAATVGAKTLIRNGNFMFGFKNDKGMGLIMASLIEFQNDAEFEAERGVEQFGYYSYWPGVEAQEPQEAPAAEEEPASESQPEEPAAEEDQQPEEEVEEETEEEETRPEPGSKTRRDSKIDDFGEKIAGARKDLYRDKIRSAKNYSTSDLKELKDPDKIFSRKNIIKAMAEGKMSKEDATALLAMNMAARSDISSAMKALALEKYRDMAVAWEAGEPVALNVGEADVKRIKESYGERQQAMPDIESRIWESIEHFVLKTFDDYHKTYEALDYPAVNRKMNGIYIRKGLQAANTSIGNRYFVVSSPKAYRGFAFEDFDKAVAKVKAMCPEIVNVTAEQAKAKKEGGDKIGNMSVVKDKYGWYRIKSGYIPGEIYLSKKFYNKKEAEQFLQENADMLIDRENKMAESLMGSNIGMVERQGKDYRGGRDITPEEFMQTFGPKGVQFGNWVPQAERQAYLNKTYDAIMDLCDILHISPESFFLGGKLGISFGGRGHSKAMAHYEPLMEVMNLTRMKGAGSLAHEWFHAMDNYLSRQKTGSVRSFATETKKTEREEVAEAFRDFVRKMDSMDYTRRSERAGEYWGEVVERAARLFENYVYNELGNKGVVSPLLVRRDTLFGEEGAEDYISSSWPYPSAKENEEIKPYFDKLFDTIQERVDENTGRTTLFRITKKEDETDMDFLRRVADDLTTKYTNLGRYVNIEDGVEGGDNGDYSDRIVRIFAKPGRDYDSYEETFFHENLHCYLESLGVDSNSPVVIDFLDSFRTNLPDIMGAWEADIREAYKDEGYVESEMFVRIVSDIMSKRVNARILFPFIPEEAMDIIDNYYNAIGYDTAEEKDLGRDEEGGGRDVQPSEGRAAGDLRMVQAESTEEEPGRDTDREIARAVASITGRNEEDVLQDMQDRKDADFITEDTRFRIRTKPEPKKKGNGYKVFYQKDGKLYPPMVANAGGEDTPVGVWLDAEAAPVVGESKTGRPKVKQGGKGTQGGSGTLAYRPGWHLGEIPYALQFNRLNPETGEKDLFPKDFVWAEVEYAADNDYQQEADAEGITENGKFRHSYAGLKRVPEDGFYRYRTNPNPETDPWIITGAMRVKRVLTNDEVDDLVRKAGREPQQREGDTRFRIDSDGEKEMLVTGMEDESSLKVPAVTSTDANVINKLDKAIEKFENGEKKLSFLAEVSKALGLLRTGSSRYGRVEAKNGVTFILRLSDHNATVSNFDNNNEDNGISIVISRKPNKKIENEGNAHIEEYFYPDKELNKAEGTPLAEIAKSIKQSLYSGQYKDTTGIAQYEEANGDGYTLFRKEIFVSNAQMALDGIRQEKATPEQWLKMLEKNGGLKAAEDKWLGLSEWLRASDAKTITKQEISDFIDENKILIEEKRYRDRDDVDQMPENELAKEFSRIYAIDVDGLTGKPFIDSFNILDAIDFYNANHEDQIDEPDDPTDISDADYNRLEAYGEELLRKMESGEFGGDAVIDTTRLGYTTEGLTHNREIALTVPTIEPWNEGDSIHFGDAGHGRAVAWVRFGDTFTERGIGEAPLYVKYVGAEPADEPHKRAIEGILLNWNDNESVMRNERKENQFWSAKSMFENALRDNYYEGTEEQRTLRAQALAALDDIKASDFDAVYETGQRVLFIDEIQSKRHQEGREKGYAEGKKAKEDAYKEAHKEAVRYTEEVASMYGIPTAISPESLLVKLSNKMNMSRLPREYEQFDEQLKKLAGLIQERNRLLHEYQALGKAVPAAPFEKNWHELAMKRMLRLAAEEGYDYIAWTKGEQQAERYDLSRTVKGLTVYENENGTYDIITLSADGTDLQSFTNIAQDKLADYVGKELAVKIANGENQEERNGRKVQYFRGLDLKIGGEGMRGFYDEILPRFMNKYGKQWGVKVEDISLTELEGGITAHAVPVTQEMKDSVMEGQTMFRKVYHGTGAEFDKFDHSFMGSGEGNQAFGWGTYVTTNKDTGLAYAKSIGGSDEQYERAIRSIENQKARDEMALTKAKTDAERKYYEDAIAIADLRKEQMKRHLYEVEIPDDNGENYLHWEKPLTGKQSRKIMDAIRKMVNPDEWGEEIEYELQSTLGPGTYGRHVYAGLNYFLGNEYNYATDEDPGAERNSKLLNSLGIVGMEYPIDIMGAKRFEGSNYVIFNDKDLKISGHTRFRIGPASGGLQGRYEERLKKIGFLEAHQDSMLALKVLQEELVKESGKPLQSFENAYLAENQLSSVNSAEKEYYQRQYFDPMIKAVRDVMDAAGMTYGEVVKYAIAKHGLERNQVFHDRDQAASDETIPYRDYSGLTSLFLLDGEDAIDLSEAEARAEQYVDNVENRAGQACANMWGKVKDATKKALYKSWQSGILTRSEYESIRDMFDFYVPLRGFDEETAEQHYEYLDHKSSPFSPALRTAKGRSSIADDPFATIGNMWESTVQQGNNNLVKQNFLNMVLNRPNELVTVKPMWYTYDAAADEWSQAVPTITDGMSKEDIQKEWDDFENRMAQMEQQGLASKKKPNRGKVNIPYRLLNKQDQEHMVVVKSAGREYVLVVNGNPRAAQAINGLTNPDRQDFLAKMAKANRWMAANFTTRSPKFVVRNAFRDTLFSLFSIDIKEDSDYNRAFRGNLMRNYGRIWGLMKRFKAGEFDDVDENTLTETERLFREFMMNGGETGYTQLKRVDEYKKMVNRIVGGAAGEKMHAVKSAWRVVDDMVGFANRCVEDICRLSAYMTSRQMGRSIQTSVAHAKEISVNFNKKGSGDGYGSSFARAAYLFYNAGVQGLNNFVNIRKNSRKHWTGLRKFDVRVAEMLALGALIPFLNNVISAAVGGDDDEYADLPDWIRRNNLVLGGGGFYVTVPLPIELRALYGIGDIAYMSLAGRMKNYNPFQLGVEVMGQIADIMPLNPVEGIVTNKGKNIGEGLILSLVPDVTAPIAQAALNVDFTGKPIYKKTTYNESMPAYTKAYAGTSKVLVRSAELLNRVTGGDEFGPGAIDINPAIVEHIMEGYFGGLLTFAEENAKTVQAIWDEDYRQLRNVPIANILFQKNDERTASSYVNDMYFYYKKEAEETNRRAKGYKAKGDLNKAAEIAGSKEYRRARLFKGTEKRIKKLQDQLKEETDKTRQDYLRRRIANEKEAFIKVLDDKDLD